MPSKKLRSPAESSSAGHLANDLPLAAPRSREEVRGQGVAFDYNPYIPPPSARWPSGGGRSPLPHRFRPENRAPAPGRRAPQRPRGQGRKRVAARGRGRDPRLEPNAVRNFPEAPERPLARPDLSAAAPRARFPRQSFRRRRPRGTRPTRPGRKDQSEEAQPARAREDPAASPGQNPPTGPNPRLEPPRETGHARRPLLPGRRDVYRPGAPAACARAPTWPKSFHRTVISAARRSALTRRRSGRNPPSGGHTRYREPGPSAAETRASAASPEDRGREAPIGALVFYVPPQSASIPRATPEEKPSPPAP